MGADLIFSWFAIKKEKYNPKDLKESEKKMLKAVDKLTEKDISEILEFLEESDELDNVETEVDKLKKSEKDPRKRIVNSLENKDNKYWMKAAKPFIKKIIKETFQSLDYRDVGNITHKGDIIFLSGGMSWGDLPTDSCDTFNKFGMLPKKILKAGGIH